MSRSKPPAFKLHELEAYQYEILDILYFEKDEDKDISLKTACRQNGISYDWVQAKAESDPKWDDLVSLYEGLEQGMDENSDINTIEDTSKRL